MIGLQLGFSSGLNQMVTGLKRIGKDMGLDKKDLEKN